MNDEKQYDIGYAKPPTHSRWTKGCSGNPSGRTFGSKNTLSLLNTLANENLKIVQNGKEIKISKKAAALLQAINKAASGDNKALKTLMPHFLSADAKEEGRLKLLDVKSPRYQTCLLWVFEIFDEALMETPGIDEATQTHVYGLLQRKMMDFDKVVDRIINDPNWTPENSPANPLLNYRTVGAPNNA
jgi:hypothetical protein